MNQKMTHKKQTPQKSVNKSQKKVSEENKDIQQPVSIPQSMHNDNNVPQCQRHEIIGIAEYQEKVEECHCSISVVEQEEIKLSNRQQQLESQDWKFIPE